MLRVNPRWRPPIAFTANEFAGQQITWASAWEAHRVRLEAQAQSAQVSDGAKGRMSMQPIYSYSACPRFQLLCLYSMYLHRLGLYCKG